MRLFVKLFSVILCVALCLSFAACQGGTQDIESTSDSPSAFTEPTTEEKPVTGKTNPLTGLDTLAEGEAGLIPVAVSVNNIGIAQSVQAGIDSADVVFEVPVEGGITRLLALYKAPKAEMGEIGSVRSARVIFAELAASMNALYFHCGQDNTYFPQRAAELNLKKVTVDSGKNGKRINNGKASEHTLYTSGEDLKNEVASYGFNTGYEAEPWMNFSQNRQASSAAAKSVKVKFSNASSASFTYDEASASYIRGVNGTPLTNYFSGARSNFTNVFVLYTDTQPYPDGLHVKVELSGGNGYYITKGGYESITWAKSGDFSPISFTAADGTPLEVSAGSSYICIADKGEQGMFSAE